MYVHKRYLFLKDVDVAGDEETCDEMVEYVSPEQLGEQLVTLSSLPESRWKNLLSLDVIKVMILGTPLLICCSIWIVFFKAAIRTISPVKQTIVLTIFFDIQEVLRRKYFITFAITISATCKRDV